MIVRNLSQDKVPGLEPKFETVGLGEADFGGYQLGVSEQIDVVDIIICDRKRAQLKD